MILRRNLPFSLSQHCFDTKKLTGKTVDALGQWQSVSVFSLFFNIYLAVLGLRCGTWASLFVARGLLYSWHVGSGAAAFGLRYPLTCGILVPQPGIESTSLALEGVFLTTGAPV